MEVLSEIGKRLAVVGLVLWGGVTSRPGFAVARDAAFEKAVSARSGCEEGRGRQIQGSDRRNRLIGSKDSTCIYGGGGNDFIVAGPADDFIVPGSGADRVRGGRGDDVVVVYDVCELAHGEVLRGGLGNDTLVLPVSLEQARRIGVHVHGFETVIVDASERCRADCRLPCSRTPEHLQQPSTLQRWNLDPGSGARYRRATETETRANRWPQGTFLLEADALLRTVTQGGLRVSLPIPVADGEVRLADLTLRRRETSLSFVERRFTSLGLRSRTVTPVLYEYVSAGVESKRARPSAGAWLGLIAGDDGGAYAYGLLDGMEIEMDAPNAGWMIESMPAPGDSPILERNLARVSLFALGNHGVQQFDQCASGDNEPCAWLCSMIQGLPCDDNDNLDPPAAFHCVDGDDNDGDDHVDSGDEECSHHPNAQHASPAVQDATWGCDEHLGTHDHRWESGKSFALFGEGRFCTQYATRHTLPDGSTSGNWIQRLTRVGWDTEAFLGTAAGFIGLSGGEGRMHYVAGGCWVFPSLEAAEQCGNGGGCDVADAAEYPYAGAGDSSASHYNNVWDDVEHAASHGLRHPLHLAQVVFGGESLDCSAEEGSGCCGAAPVAFPASNVEDLPVHQRGSSMFQYDGGCSSNAVVASHELAHSMGLDHDLIQGPCTGQVGTCTGFMNDSSGTIPVLTAANIDQLVGSLLTWNSPRPSGFRYNGPGAPEE